MHVARNDRKIELEIFKTSFLTRISLKGMERDPVQSEIGGRVCLCFSLSRYALETDTYHVICYLN